MAREILAIFEVELVLSALLRRTGRDDALGGRIAQDGSAELLVHQDAGLRRGRAARQRRLEAVVDHLLGAGDLGGLRVAQRRLPAEQLGLEGATVIERQDIERAIEPSSHQAGSLELAIAPDQRVGRAVMLELAVPQALSSSGTIFWASALPSSTPHWSKESICQIVPWVKTLCS